MGYNVIRIGFEDAEKRFNNDESVYIAVGTHSARFRVTELTSHYQNRKFIQIVEEFQVKHDGPAKFFIVEVK